jgi:hypothetical protein
MTMNLVTNSGIRDTAISVCFGLISGGHLVFSSKPEAGRFLGFLVIVGICN